jgi:microcystin degradation protein MlrC
MQVGVNKGIRRDIGPAALLDLGKVQVLVCSKRFEPYDPGVFSTVGIDPARMKYLLLKSRIHYRAGFAGLAKHTVLCDGKGVTSSDNTLFRFKNVRRPIYPLDKNVTR